MPEEQAACRAPCTAGLVQACSADQKSGLQAVLLLCADREGPGHAVPAAPGQSPVSMTRSVFGPAAAIAKEAFWMQAR